tara:strand:- start:398 stop:1003 length:606 start_codon:yes stop_codon:yes gene_type:complete
MTDTIEAELHRIQTNLHVGKDKVNDFGGYNYRTAEGIIAAVKPMLPEGAFLTLTDDIREVAGQVFLFATATLTLADGTKQSTQSAALHPLTKKGMDPSQITGSASSYARKYALSGLFAIDDGKEEIDGRKQAYEPDQSEEVARLTFLIENAQTGDDLKRMKVNEKPALDALTDESFEKVKLAFTAANKRISNSQTDEKEAA